LTNPGGHASLICGYCHFWEVAFVFGRRRLYGAT
jgi:hypothetical protein